MGFVTVQGHKIEYEFIRAAAADAPILVFLHEGLGSVALWKDFPSRVAHATECNALVYSRYGYGRSTPLQAPRQFDFMHQEAFMALPELLDAVGVEKPVLFGHSDGASISLIYAGGTGRAVAGLILMAPHVMVEDSCLASIRAVRQTYLSSDLHDKLARYHDNPDSAFWGWNDVWLNPEFRAWNIQEFLPRITCPMLAIQGENDEYGSMAQIDLIAERAPDVELLKLTDCGHSPHRDQPGAVIEATTRLVDRIRQR